MVPLFKEEGDINVSSDMELFLELIPAWNIRHLLGGASSLTDPARRQAIIWTNDGWFTDAYMRHPATMSYLLILIIWFQTRRDAAIIKINFTKFTTVNVHIVFAGYHLQVSKCQ